MYDLKINESLELRLGAQRDDQLCSLRFPKSKQTEDIAICCPIYDLLLKVMEQHFKEISVYVNNDWNDYV